MQELSNMKSFLLNLFQLQVKKSGLYHIKLKKMLSNVF